ncbi:hypothetical protein L1887_16572 [Cichorium endivia]|nr:hypothetical protein L1887_16572 [Cichorium endivia]
MEELKTVNTYCRFVAGLDFNHISLNHQRDETHPTIHNQSLSCYNPSIVSIQFRVTTLTVQHFFPQFHPSLSSHPTYFAIFLGFPQVA